MIPRWLHVIITLFSLPLLGCSPPTSTGTGPPSNLTDIEQVPASTAASGGYCYDTIGTTPLTQFTAYYSDKSPETEPIFWYAPDQDSTLYIYTGLLPAGGPDQDGGWWSDPFSAAIDAWYNVLQNDVQPGHYVRLNPVETANYQQALVQVRIVDNYVSNDLGGQTDFGTVTGPGSIARASWNQLFTFNSEQPYLAGALITLNDGVSGSYIVNDTYRYAVSLHEMGHALGLDHNPQVASVMYPRADIRLNQGCSAYGQYPQVGDVSALEGHYDPILRSPPPDSPICRPNMVCAYARPRVLLGNSTANVANSPWAQVDRYGQKLKWIVPHISEKDINQRVSAKRNAQYASSRNAPNVEGLMRNLRWWHGTFDGPVDFRQISSATLALSSTLIAKGHLIQILYKSAIGPVPSQAYEEFQIDQVLDAARGAGEAAKVGDRIVLAEQYAYEDIPYSDDPMLKPTQQVTIFVRPVSSSGLKRRGIAGRVYTLTAPLVAKWVERPSGSATVLGPSNTRVARELRSGAPVARAIVDMQRSSMGSSDQRPMSQIRHDVLRSRGENPEAYASSFKADPTTELLRQAGFDQALKR
jgi:hypothetical protein